MEALKEVIEFKQEILEIIDSRDFSPVKQSVLARQLNVSSDEWPQFKAALDELLSKGRIVMGPKNLINRPGMGNQLTGTFRANPRGFGFILPSVPTSYGDLFVGPNDTAGAMNNDTVLAKVVKKGHRGGQVRMAGIITQVLERANAQVIGTLQKKDSLWIVEPEGKGFLEPVIIEDVGAKDAKAGQKVAVDIIHYPRDGELSRGVIVKIIGKAGRYETEIKATMMQYGLPEDFSEACREQALAAARDFDPDSAPERDDISNEVLVTIDPPDARDFDDAISLRRSRDGNWVLGIHIADASTFIPQDSPLDREARLRGNSVYLPGRVVPMLPEVLSNGICSLQPGQKRFAKSVYVTYDEQGKVLASEFANSIIQSSARLTYVQADNIIRGHLKGHADGLPGEVVALLKDMETLAKAIEKRREKNGMLHLDLPETELVFDEKGFVVDAVPAEQSYPHTIIEMFMVEANEAVASLLDRFKVPFMRRIHPDPEPTSRRDVSRFVKLCGMKVPRNLDRHAIQDLLDAVKGKPSSFAINMHILRSLQKAEYAPLHIGHFALASKHYCHFTSPIRRYADLMVHRLLQCYLDNRLNKIGLEEVLPEADLKTIGRHISFTEQNATDAERDLRLVLILEMLKGHIGEEFDGVVSGLTNFGAFIHLTKFGIEGMIEPGELGLDEWKFDERNQALVGSYSGHSVNMGQPMRVKIVSVNQPARQLFLAPVETLIDRREPLRHPKKSRRSSYRNKPSRGRRRR